MEQKNAVVLQQTAIIVVKKAALPKEVFFRVNSATPDADCPANVSCGDDCTCGNDS